MYHWLAHHHRVPNAKSYNYIFWGYHECAVHSHFPYGSCYILLTRRGGVCSLLLVLPVPRPFCLFGFRCGSSGVAVIKQVLGIRDFLSHPWTCESLTSALGWGSVSLIDIPSSKTVRAS